MPKILEVGGCVRDKLLGLNPKDIDFVFVLDDSDAKNFTADEAFIAMEQWLQQQNFKIFLTNADCFTIRCKFPNSNLVADFVMARKEIGYNSESRKPICVPGSLEDDLVRRDFTLNAMAMDPNTGQIIDLFGGTKDLSAKILRTPLPAMETFNDDPLRILRALRFKITKGFEFCEEISQTLSSFPFEQRMSLVSAERIREELHKMFAMNSLEAMKLLMQHENLSSFIFNNTKLKLMPTLKQL